jgi:hypothetical protein
MAGPKTVEDNRYTVDARKRIERLRAVADEFPDETELQPLTPMEVRLARHTSVEALERAANLLEHAPNLAANIDINELREVIFFELAYDGVVGEARSVAFRIERAILRRKLNAVRQVRALYRIAKSHMTLDGGENIEVLVQSLKHTLVRPRRRKKSETAE